MAMLKNVLSKSSLGAAAVGAVMALTAVQAEAASIKIEDLNGVAADVIIADTGNLASANFFGTFAGITLTVTASPFETANKSFLNTISVALKGLANIRITVSEDDYSAGAAGSSLSQLAFSISSTNLGKGASVSAKAFVDDNNVLEAQGTQIGTNLSLAGLVETPDFALDSTTGSSMLSAPFSMTSIFEIVHTDSNDATSFDATAVAAVPVPAAGLLLITALGGMAAMRRRRKSAA